MFGYTGKMFDDTIDLQWNVNRWYDANVGRWINEDPIGFQTGDANLYRYVGNAVPVSTDPSGLWTQGMGIISTIVSTLKGMENTFGTISQIPIVNNVFGTVTQNLSNILGLIQNILNPTDYGKLTIKKKLITPWYERPCKFRYTVTVKMPQEIDFVIFQKTASTNPLNISIPGFSATKASAGVVVWFTLEELESSLIIETKQQYPLLGSQESILLLYV